MASVRALRIGLCAALCVSAIACSGGGGTTAASGSSSGGVGGSSSSSGGTSSSSSSSSGGTSSSSSGAGTGNVAAVIIDQGPSNASVNTLFTSVTVCVPGSTTSCQTINHIQVDTGSYGLRILAPVLTLTLPVVTLTGGNSLAECTQFVDGYSWGPVVSADVQIAGETAHSLPMQVIGDSRFTTIPTTCSNTGGTQEDTVASFGANGILGVGPFELDCGDCDTVARFYYACAATCSETTVPLNMQVANPVTRFTTDNNGVIVVLPSVAAGGASNVSGSLIFGIDTQSNNQSGTQTVLTVDSNANLLITFNGQSLANSFIDSGSNGIYFNDSSISKCTAPPNDPTSQIVNFYCPANTLSLGPVSIQGMNGVMANNLTFSVGNAQTMLNNNFDAYPQLAGTNPNTGSFDFGLAFFYGKRVAVAVENDKTSVGTGPYIAF